jgi:hypothetical protein
MMLNGNDEMIEDLLVIHLCNADDSLYMFNTVSIMLIVPASGTPLEIHLPHHQRLTPMTQTMSHVTAT